MALNFKPASKKNPLVLEVLQAGKGTEPTLMAALMLQNVKLQNMKPPNVRANSNAEPDADAKKRKKKKSCREYAHPESTQF